MSTPRHLVGVPAGEQFRVACPSGSVQQSGAPFRDYGRAKHWRDTCNSICCAPGHEVVPVHTTRAVQSSRGER